MDPILTLQDPERADIFRKAFRGDSGENFDSLLLMNGNMGLGSLHRLLGGTDKEEDEDKEDKEEDQEDEENEEVKPQTEAVMSENTLELTDSQGKITIERRDNDFDYQEDEDEEEEEKEKEEEKPKEDEQNESVSLVEKPSEEENKKHENEVDISKKDDSTPEDQEK